jgi:AmmeMemoRadiSam system protein B/AmmeMemoRadiSam system protein A
MKKSWIIAFLAALAPAVLGQDVRRPVWAGQFYEENRERLSAQLDGFFKGLENVPAVAGDIEALIVPHAGYVYSGKTAAAAYSLVRGKAFETVVIIGPSHRHGFEGCSIYPKGGFETPLGVVAVDDKLAAELSRASGFGFVPEAHQEEHSLEVQVPFIQKVLPGVRIVPIVMGYPSRRTIEALASALAKVLPGRSVLVVASTDMSHFFAKEKARKVDQETAALIKDLKIDSLVRKVVNGENIMCGGGGVAAVLTYAQKRGTPRVDILRYAESSEAGGPANEVVGYLAAVVTAGPAAEDFTLTAGEKKELLKLAREAVVEFVEKNKVLSYETKNPRFISPKGAFVTLRKRGALRGCIGFIEPVLPLYQAVIQTAIYAASEDQRFLPVSTNELPELEYEVSVLTPLRKISDPQIIQVGKHGLVISRDGNRGLLLPQVPVENHWNREAFLEQACLKAGLPPDAWKKGAEIFVFEAIVF